MSLVEGHDSGLRSPVGAWRHRLASLSWILTTFSVESALSYPGNTLLVCNVIHCMPSLFHLSPSLHTQARIFVNTHCGCLPPWAYHGQPCSSGFPGTSTLLHLLQGHTHTYIYIYILYTHNVAVCLPVLPIFSPVQAFLLELVASGGSTQLLFHLFLGAAFPCQPWCGD